MIWNTASSCVASRPATVITTSAASQPAIHSAAVAVEGTGRGVGAETATAQARSSLCTSSGVLAAPCFFINRAR